MCEQKIEASLALPALRKAWDAYRGGQDLPLSDAWLFAAGYTAAQSASSPDMSETSRLRIDQLARLLVSCYPETLRNMYCAGEPVGQLLVDAVTLSPSEVTEQTEEQALAVARYQWARQPSNLNCLMFEFKGNTPAAVDAYIDHQIRALTPATV